MSIPADNVCVGGGVAAEKDVDEDGAECLGGRRRCGVLAEEDTPGESNPGDSPVGNRRRTNKSALFGDLRDRTTQKLRPPNFCNDCDSVAFRSDVPVNKNDQHLAMVF